MNYKELVKEYLAQMSTRTQKLAINAIKVITEQDDDRDYRWIYTALTLKDVECWESWGFGLWFKTSFINQVFYEMQHEDNLEAIQRQAEKIDIDSFWNEELSSVLGD